MSGKSQLSPTQELVYEMKVDEVMTRRVVAVSPEMLMSELREILRSNRISGAPVVSNGELIGIVSIEDFIKWLADGPPKARVDERMTQDVMIVYDNDSLVQVVSRLDQHGYGRLPVVQRD